MQEWEKNHKGHDRHNNHTAWFNKCLQKHDSTHAQDGYVSQTNLYTSYCIYVAANTRASMTKHMIQKYSKQMQGHDIIEHEPVNRRR
jgi:hypothetical protein